ncbi:hypothetical protein ACOMHN_053655 [Nucella lapillus]
MCSGNQTMGIYFTLMLAIVRFVRLFYPSRAHHLLSRFRLKLSLVLIMFWSLTLQAFISGRYHSVPKEYQDYIMMTIKTVGMTTLPILIQNVLMFIVMVKLWLMSKKIISEQNNEFPQLPEEGEGTFERDSHTVGPGKVTSGLQARSMMSGHRRMGSVAEPTTVETSLVPEVMIQTEIQTAKHRDAISKTEPQTDVVHETEPQTDVVHETELQTATQRVATSETELQTATQRDTVSGFQPQTAEHRLSPALLQGSSSLASHIVMLELSDISRTFMADSSTKMIQARVKQKEIDRRIIFIVLAICLTSFVTYPLCSTMGLVFYQLKWTKTPDMKFCGFLPAVNSSINVVFYMFIGAFRSTFSGKVAKCLIGLLPSESFFKLSVDSMTETKNSANKAAPVQGTSDEVFGTQLKI